MSLLEEHDTIRESAGEAGGGLFAKEAITSAIGGAAAGIGKVISVAGVAVATVASVMINQSAYQRKLISLRQMYKDEIGAQLGKSPSKVTYKDMKLIAEGDSERGISSNKTIADEMNRLAKRRNVGILVTAASLLATVGVMIAVAPALSLSAGASTLAVMGVYAAKALIGFSTHRVLEVPIKAVAKSLFHLKEKTTHERIAGLAKEHRNGKVLGREQVLDVFICSDDQLKQFVTDHYGKSYDKLNVQEKRVVADAMEQYIPVTHITENLNSGSVKVSELAFLVEGKKSGVIPNSVKPNLSLAGKARTALRSVGERLHKIKPQDAGYEQNIMQNTENVSVAPKRAIMEYDNPVPARSFVARYESEKSPAVGHAIH